MRDRLGYCAKCLDPFAESPRSPHHEDLCWYCAHDLTDDLVSQMAEYFGATGATAPIPQPQTR